jgi:hypothetical protein
MQMDNTRKTISCFIQRSGIQIFQMISGLSIEEIESFMRDDIVVSSNVFDRINSTMDRINKITSDSKIGINRSRKIKVKPNAELVANVRKTLEESEITIEEFAYRASLGCLKLREWIMCCENKFGWVNIEVKINRALFKLRRELAREQKTKQQTHEDRINVERFVNGFLLTRASASPKQVSKCNDNH